MKINLVLTAYFNAEWKYAFDPKLTKKVDFHTSANTVTPVDMMSITGEFVLEYIKAIDTDVLHLPFKQKHLKMTLLVPRKIDGINTLIQNLTMVHMTNLHRRGKARPVNVQLPKFKIDSEDDLKKPMQDLGIHDLFSNVNISKLATSKGPLKVDHIIQRVVLDVDERGAEVAFASRTSLKPQHIVVDRPFLFLVREDNDVYFAGRVNFTP
ncbi:hypothetical protein AWZ03_004101 [Drosophila navojoa]|uniref:Serpin domain-containing protein n=2 Tax=Drosophila navojoa TaxID=7232 RepID=A0A484BL03_DRONA|nr:hypothetical protein AWZ03_004101 [Drosophila navojoa]